MTKRRPPEPATPPSLRAVQLGIRATAEQAQAYREAAEAAGVSLGRWMRAACDAALAKNRHGLIAKG